MRKQVLQRMRGSEDIEEEFEAIKLNYWEVEQEQLNKSTIIQIFVEALMVRLR